MRTRWSTVWNPNKLIQVELIFDGDVISMSVDELKEYLLASFAGRPQGLANWNPGSITLVEMQDGLKAAKTFSEVFRLVLQKVLIKPELR